MEDVFGIQEDISRQIVVGAEGEADTAAEERRVAERPIDDPVAYECYLRACHLMYDVDAGRADVAPCDSSMRPSKSPARCPLLLAMKGQLHWNTVNTSSWTPRQRSLEEADALANRALALDAGLAISPSSCAASWQERGDSPKQGLPDLYRAHELRPGDGNVLVEVSRFSLGAGSAPLAADGGPAGRDRTVEPAGSLAGGDVRPLGFTAGRREAARHASARHASWLPMPSMLHVGAAWLHGGGRAPD